MKKITLSNHNKLVAICETEVEYALWVPSDLPYIRQKVASLMFKHKEIHTFLQVCPLERTDGYDINPVVDLLIEHYVFKKQEIQFLIKPPAPTEAALIIADKSRWNKVHN